MQQVRRRKERGFTIIELVVVILLLGILAAVALPRFINVTDRAYGSAVEGVYGGFATGVAMYRAQYVADGQRDPVVSVENVGLPFNLTTGYPAIADATACENIWKAVLQSGRPSVSYSGADVDGALVNTDLANVGFSGNDFEIVFDENTTVPACYYVYTAQYGEQTPAAATDTNRPVAYILYNQNGQLALNFL